MDQYKETFDTWNNVASLYEQKFMQMDFYNDTYDYFCKHIQQPNATILEIGCGPGNITKYLLCKRPDFNIYGIDIAPNMIALAKQHNPTARFAVMDSRQIRTLHTTYDGIIAGFCLPYLSPVEGRELVAAAGELLNSNGMIYLSFVEGAPEQSGFKTGSGGRVYFYYHLLNDLKEWLNTANFDGIEVFTVNYPTSATTFDVHTIVTARKK